jgi:hypothetical protein
MPQPLPRFSLLGASRSRNDFALDLSGNRVNTIVLPRGEWALASRHAVLSCRQCKGSALKSENFGRNLFLCQRQQFLFMRGWKLVPRVPIYIKCVCFVRRRMGVFRTIGCKLFVKMSQFFAIKSLKNTLKIVAPKTIPIFVKIISNLKKIISKII